MVLNKISAIAIGSMLCVHTALSETRSFGLPSDTSTTKNSTERAIDLRLESIADSISFVDLEDELERRSEEHTSELQSLMRISYAVFCLKKKNKKYLKRYNKRSTYTRHRKHLLDTD